jgi:hypothetical protein
MLKGDEFLGFWQEKNTKPINNSTKLVAASDNKQ